MIDAADFAPRMDLDRIIAELEKTSEDAWQTEVVRHRHADGSTTNCVMGHIYDLGGGDETVTLAGRRRPCPGGSLLWDWFEERWATTFMIYPVNDGRNPRYQQPTPRQRVLAYLRALSTGSEMSTQMLMAAYDDDDASAGSPHTSKV